MRIFDFAASPWFKFEAKKITDDCLEVFDSIQEVDVRKGKAREVSYDDDNGHLVYVVGRIPLENIALVTWEGDPAYSLPRLYCHYGWRGPFREVLLFQKDDQGRFSEMQGVTLKGKRFRFPRRIWMNWQFRREDKKASKEQWRAWED